VHPKANTWCLASSRWQASGERAGGPVDPEWTELSGRVFRGAANVRLVRGAGAVRRLAAAPLPPGFRSPAAGRGLVRRYGVVDNYARDVAGHVAAQVSVADVRDDGRRVALDRVAEAVALEAVGEHVAPPDREEAGLGAEPFAARLGEHVGISADLAHQVDS
jgi:hypothetical protein